MWSHIWSVATGFRHLEWMLIPLSPKACERDPSTFPIRPCLLLDFCKTLLYLPWLEIFFFSDIYWLVVSLNQHHWVFPVGSFLYFKDSPSFPWREVLQGIFLVVFWYLEDGILWHWLGATMEIFACFIHSLDERRNFLVELGNYFPPSIGQTVCPPCCWIVAWRGIF